MRLPHIDRKRAALGWLAFVIARKLAKRKMRQKLRAVKPPTRGRLGGLRKAVAG